MSLNLNELKNGSKFKIHNKEYEATISKAKSSFSCLGRKDGSLQAINNFKYIIQVKQVMDIPKPVAPLISINHVEVPDSVNSYLTKKNKKLKRLLTRLGIFELNNFENKTICSMQKQPVTQAEKNKRKSTYSQMIAFRKVG